jgi:hypothetical protein
MGSSCRAGTRRCRLQLDDHPSARIASNRVMQQWTTIEAKLVRKLSGNTTIVGTAGLGGYGFNAVHRNVRFAPQAAVPQPLVFASR